MDVLTLTIAGSLTFLFTTLLTIAGLGAAFILIPVFMALGIDIHTSMATALLLNSVAMIFASWRFVRARLVLWKVAIPIIIVASILSPLGAWVSQDLNRTVLLWGFVTFLLFAAAMMVFYKPKEREVEASFSKQMISGSTVGAFAGFLGGLLGVGGGNFIVPVLVWLGINPKKASATTSFIVIFSSFAGFMGHATTGSISYGLLAVTATASAAGAVVGSWLMTDKLNRRQVKLIIASVLVVVAAKIIWNLVA